MKDIKVSSTKMADKVQTKDKAKTKNDGAKPTEVYSESSKVK